MSIVSNYFPEVLESELQGRLFTRKPKSQPRPRPRPTRRIRLVRPLDAEGRNGLVAITVGEESADYSLDRFEAEWGTGYRLEKRGGQAYDVNLDAADYCQCRGHASHGRCKHTEGLRALARVGKLALTEVRP